MGGIKGTVDIYLLLNHFSNTKSIYIFFITNCGLIFGMNFCLLIRLLFETDVWKGMKVY
uniref:Uncharacterized protein n=1 Tax=Meloidogyne enterolobii TaxID=390850 RepID=A0A6V7U3P3_MELEN|nr:unnamed protein product [Meloidogyne enterolobii]